MADENATAAPDGRSRPTRAREWITSIVLIAFTSAVGIACVIALSSTLTQTRMSSIAIDGVPLSIWKLDDIRRQWSKIREGIGDLSNKITQAEGRRGAVVGEMAHAAEKFSARNTTLVIHIDELLFRIKAFDPALAAKVEDTADTRHEHLDAKEKRKASPAEQYGELSAARAGVLKDHAELASLFDDLDKAYKEYAEARGVRLEANAKSQAIIQEIKGLQDAMAGSRTSLESLYRQINPKFTQNDSSTALDDATRFRIENALYELHSGNPVIGHIVNLLITTQPDILTLTLVILMGVLGSSLQMTYAFFRQHRIERVGAYLLRVCVGAITALVIFIVAKAGVPVIADATRLGGDAAINPYFVSFLAIISGLMSENAILSVQNQGAKFFGADMPAEPQRWARQDLRETFKTSNRNPEHVKRLLQAKDDEFEGWVSGREPMPANVQMIIAGVLQIPPRDLYTDIPPDQAGTTA
jgi:hypothetical protein